MNCVDCNIPIYRQSTRCRSCVIKRRIGVNHPRWSWGDCGYFGIRQWINRNWGRANKCENDITHESTKYEWACITGNYTRNREDYKMLCNTCHKRLDDNYSNRKRNKKGQFANEL